MDKKKRKNEEMYELTPINFNIECKPHVKGIKFRYYNQKKVFEIVFTSNLFFVEN